MKGDPANMGQYIDVDLTRLYNLDLSTKEKPVMNVDDGLSVIPVRRLYLGPRAFLQFSSQNDLPHLPCPQGY
jgi:hypothetical protein